MMNTGCKLILIVLALFSIPCGYAAEKPLQAGYGEFNITPKLGTTMPGYFSERRADGILDPLLAKVLLLRHENTEIAIIAADLIGIPKPVVDKIRQEITQKTKIPTDHIFIHATHTHTGATVSEIADVLPNQFTKAVQRAQQNTQKTPSISYGCGEEHSVAFIRRFLMKNGTVRTNPGRQNPEVVKPIG
ncbi:hypothetical protein GF373_02360, partial [bacterium]|nr:hypothetical protein [bacterium]